MKNNKLHNFRLLTLIAVLVGALLAPSCAGMMQSWRRTHCNYNGAYQLGMNDARNNNQMSSAIAMHCPAEGQAEAQRGYREGFTNGASSAGVAVQIAQAPWQCKSAYGQKACGYTCIAAYGALACASQPHHNCVQGYGQVRCGQNCRAEYGQIQCD